MSVTTNMMCNDSKGASSKDGIQMVCAMTNHYVSEIFHSPGILLHQLQRVVDLGTLTVTASHDAIIQFCPTTKRTGMYQYIIQNVCLMPCTLLDTHTQKRYTGIQ